MIRPSYKADLVPANEAKRPPCANHPERASVVFVGKVPLCSACYQAIQRGGAQ